MASELVTATVQVDDNGWAAGLFGRADENLRLIERRFPIKLVPRGNQVTITGAPDDVRRVHRILLDLLELARTNRVVTPGEVRSAIDLALDGSEKRLHELTAEPVFVTARGKAIRPNTLGQRAYVEAMRQNSLVFAIGPAGTGKTYLAVAMAVAMLRAKTVGRIVLTRPAVEAGEKLGFLPGDLQEKVDPYLRPLYDALYDLLGGDGFQRYMEKGAVEVAPLAYMRGRTLHDAFIILDEGQNTTPEQMKMFLTRMGHGSRVVVTGDITQVDLPKGVQSGILHAETVLTGVEGIAFLRLTERDVVRHELVQRIVEAYARHAGDEPSGTERAS